MRNTQPKEATMKTTLTAIALSIAALTTQAQPLNNQGGACPTDVNGAATGSCTNQNQIQGDTTSSVTGDVQAPVTSAQQGVSSTSTASGNEIAPVFDNKAQVTQNSTNTTTGTINPVISPNTSSRADGNTSANNNQSSATTGASTSSTGPVASTNANTAQGGSSSGTNLSANRNTNSGGAGGSALAGGGAGGQGGASSAQGGTSGASAQGGAGAAGNSTTRVDASDRSTTNYTSRATVLPPTVHGAAAPPLAVGHMAAVSTPCGPRVGIVRRDIVGKRFGVWGGQDDVLQGQDEITAPAAQPFVVVDGYLLGHIVTTYTATVGTSSAGSFSVGGYGKSGEGAQGGGAASGQLQQIVQRVVVTECLMPVAAPAPIIVQQGYAPEPQRPVPRQDRN